MSEYFVLSYTGAPFQRFGLPHLIAISTVIAINVLLVALLRVERDGALRPAVEAPVALLVAAHARGGNFGAGDRMLRHATVRADADLHEFAGRYGCQGWTSSGYRR